MGKMKEGDWWQLILDTLAITVILLGLVVIAKIAIVAYLLG